MTAQTSDYSYLSLDKDVEAAILEHRASATPSPFAYPDSQVIRREDNPHDRATVTRSAFVRDIEKILNIPAYNRYIDKTQVFSFRQNDEISRRGLHVQLVSRVARGIGELLNLNTELIEAIALGHDVGHTPFGHAGERFLSAVYHDHTGRYFNHNVHSVRVLDQLYRRNLSLQTLDGVLCHNGEFVCQNLSRGSMQSFEQLDATVEACAQDQATIKTLRPSTLEGCVVRVSDMIAYLGKDRQDALFLGAIDSYDGFESNVIGLDNAHIIHNITVDIVNHSYGKDQLSMSEEVFKDMKLAKAQNYEIIYDKEGMDEEAENLLQKMFVRLYERLLQDLLTRDESSPLFRHHIHNLLRSSRSISLEEYLAQDPHQIVVDYIASMTDSYFLATYRYLFPEEELPLPIDDYFADLR